MVNFEVWDWNDYISDAMVGQGVLTIQQITANNGGLCPVQLTYKGKATGQLSVQVKYHEDGAKQGQQQGQQQQP